MTVVLTAFTTVNVNIRDENDRPVYIGPKSFQIVETLSLGSAVGVISATDPDLESLHAYSELNFEIVFEEPQNLVKTALVTSSDSYSTTENLLQNILVENFDTYWHTATSFGWLTIDLLKIMEFKKIELTWKGFNSPTRIIVDTSDTAHENSQQLTNNYKNFNLPCGVKDRRDILTNFNKTSARFFTIKFEYLLCNSYAWEVTNNFDCGGSDIAPSWADGTATSFGLLVAGESSSVDECKKTCGNHPDCKGFNYKISNGLCSFWKTGNAGSIHLTVSTDYNCYEKASINTLKLTSLRIYGTRVFSVDQTHSDLLAKERATMLVLRDRQSTASQLSFLSKPNYKVYVKVSDFNKHFVEGLIQVKITDMNEAPIIGRDPSLSFALPLDNVRYIEEDASKGSPVGNPILVFDPDITQSHLFSVEFQSNDIVFSIDQCSGQLEVVSYLNFEMRNNYSIDVRVEDDHVMPLHDIMTVTILIVDVNEAPVILTRQLNFVESTWYSQKLQIITNGIVMEKNDTNNASVYTIKYDGILYTESPSRLWVKFQSLDKKYSCGPFRLRSIPIMSTHKFSIIVHPFEDFQPSKNCKWTRDITRNGTTENDPLAIRCI